MKRIKTVQSNVTSGYYCTVVDTDTQEVVFCSTISSYRGDGKKKVTPETQAKRFVNQQEKNEDTIFAPR